MDFQSVQAQFGSGFQYNPWRVITPVLQRFGAVNPAYSGGNAGVETGGEHIRFFGGGNTGNYESSMKQKSQMFRQFIR